MALQATALKQANIVLPSNTSPGSAPSALRDAGVDTYAPAAPRRSWHRVQTQGEPLRQGEQRAGKGIGDTIVNSIIFGFFASCGAAAFNSVRGACC